MTPGEANITCRGPDRPTDGRALPRLILYLLTPALIAALMAYYLHHCRAVVGEVGFPLDDSWIHVRFAQNLARGFGFSFNPGEAASTTTGPLWTLLLALGYRLTGEYLFTAAALNWVLCWLCAIAAAALARTFVPRPLFAAAAGLFVAITIPLPWLALSGMEPPLFMCLTLLGILAHVRLRAARGPTALLPTAIFGVAVWARPENLLLFPLAMLDRLALLRGEHAWRPSLAAWLKQVAVHTPLFLAVIAPIFVYNYQVIGRPLPSSYYIKAMNYGLTWALVMGDDRLLLQSLFLAPIKEVGALLLLWAGNNVMLLPGFLYGFSRMVRPGGFPREHRSYLVSLVLVVQPVAWAISTNFHRAPWFQSQRYVANLGPLYLILGLAGSWWVIQRLSPARRRYALAVGIALALIASAARHPDQARLYTQNVKNITELQVAAGRWVRDYIPGKPYLAVNDVGAVAVITDCRVFDMMGLVSPETLACLTIENARTGAWRDCLRRTLAREEPDYLVIVTSEEAVEGYARGSYFLAPIYRVAIEDNITAGGDTAAILPTIWCRHLGADALHEPQA